MRAAIIEKITPAAVHDRCRDELSAGQRASAEATMLARRSEEWATLCPPIYQDTDESLIPNQKALRRVLDWQMGATGLLLHGTPGKGKSRALWAILKREHESGRFIAAMTHTEFARKATAAAREGDKQAARWIRLLTDADILGIDDLGKSKFTTLDGTGKAAEEMIYDVLESRWNHKRPCLITTNDTGASIAAKMSDRGPAFVRRLREFQTAISF
jgi:DNA replication protein DnaC